MRARPPESTLRDSTEPGAPARGDLMLVVGAGTVTTHHVLADEVVIGRDPACDVVVAHKALSRRHAKLVLGPPATVEDLGSTNGTRIGGDLVRGAKHALRAGDAFHIGPFSFVLVSAGRGGVTSVHSGGDPLRIDDPTYERATATLRDVAASSMSVLVLGETGSGKEVLAETIHRLSGRDGPLVRINCAALSESLLEGELFGHTKGAFTGAIAARAGLLEAAAGGTVFLDEIGELPAGIQAKLLRAVESREILRIGSTTPIKIDVRFVSATNRDLPAEVDAGRFRRDLFFRLDGVTLRIPPLRERRGMISALALQFAGKALAPEVLDALEAYHWPGNVRELKAVIERAALLARGASIAKKHLALAPVDAKREASEAAPADEDLSFLTPAQRRERAEIIAALGRCAGNQTRAAKELGLARATFAMRLQLYRVPRPRGR